MLALYQHQLASKRIYLASLSLQRQKILQEIGLPFILAPSDFPEDLDQTNYPCLAEYVIATARQKALDVERRLEMEEKIIPHLIIAADTVVVLDSRIIGKPESEQHNINILAELSGKKHCVMTGVAFIENHGLGDQDPDPEIITRVEHSLHDVTEVQMATLTTEAIRAYVETGEPRDKAGGYAIQGMASTFIERIDGDYFNVVGLPAYKVAEHICNLCNSGW